jgi:rhodanese-related sulfurtransferase
MKPNIDIVIDCTAPERLAEFWAAALGYDKVGWFDPYFLLAPPVTGFPSVVLKQVVADPATTTTQRQLQIRTDDVHGEAERLERLGATRVEVDHTGDEEWIAMADPQGNEFCVCPELTSAPPDRLGSGQSIDELLAAARNRLDRIAPGALTTEHANGALIIDIRPADQRTRDGELPDAIVIDRNVLEWRLDPQSDHRIFQVTGYDTRIVIVCNEGYSSSLAAATLQDLGLHRATDMIGGYQAWLTAHASAT